LQNWQDYLANHVNLVILSELTSLTQIGRTNLFLTHTVDFFSATAKAYSQPLAGTQNHLENQVACCLRLPWRVWLSGREKEVNGHVNG